MAGKNGKTRPFTAVNYSAARLAREKQRREYEQQKKEKLIFALFVVIILVMILFAILIFRKVLGGDETVDPSLVSESGESGTETETEAETGALSAYENKVFAKNEIYTGDLILIDSSHPYRNTTAPTLRDIYSSRNKFEKASSSTGYAYSYYPAGKTEMLATETIEALNQLADEFYRQKGNNDLYVHAGEAYVAGSGDEHATGYAFDLSVYTIDHIHYELNDSRASADFKWVESNYYKYGFIRRYPEAKSSVTGVSDDPYHFRYVGIAHAYYMFKNNLCLEEYLELLRTRHAFRGAGEDNLVFTADDGCRYEVYYVAAEGDMIQVPILSENASFEVSGDNMGGFVVTIKHK